jgi:peptide/nickel transport system substrate-binding protein
MTMRRLLLATVFVAAALPAAAQNLSVTWGEDDNSARTYDPRVTQSRHETQVIYNIFDQLIASDGDSKLHPGLATSWQVAPDGLSITLKLREGVTFHDGTPFNAEAVAFTLDSIVDPKLGSQGAVDVLGPYKATEIIGPYEVKITYKRPWGAAAPSLSQSELSMVSPTAVKKLGDAGFAAAPVGTGPFRFVSWERSQQVVTERFEPYNWAPEFMKHKGPSKVARVNYRFIPDASTRVAALERGEIDISDLTPVLDMQRFQSDPKFRTMIGESTGLPTGLLLNTDHGIFTDKRVRQAFILGIDRARLVDDLFFGLVKPVYGPLSRATPGYWPGVEKYYPFDPKQAAALLDEAGWKPGPDGVRVKDGQRLAASFDAPQVMEPEMGVGVQADLKKLGFDIKIEVITFAKREELVMSNQNSVQVLRWVSGDPSCLEIIFHSRNIPHPGYGKFNYSHLNDPAVDKALEDAAGAPDPARRDALYADAQKRIMDAAVWVPMHEQVNTIAYRAEHSGYSFARTRWNVNFYDVE